MHTKRIATVVALAALAIVMVLWAPGTPPTTTALAAGSDPAPDPPQPERQGGWLDSIVFTEEDSPPTAVSQLQADELDLYADLVTNPSLVQTVLEDPELAYTEAYGNDNELTFNPYGPTFDDGRLNPFSSAAIREAMNRLIDRNFIAQVISAGLAVPRWVPAHTTSADYDRYRTTIEGIEAAYAYDLSQAQADIAAEMTALGAYLQGGTWHYNGQQVVLIALIRVEDERLQIGDYVADQLEAIGFAVERQYKTSTQASPCWLQGDPAEGCFHVYTGGWVSSAISRDEGWTFDFYYNPRGVGFPLWQAYQPSPEFDEVALRLSTYDFETMAERQALFEQALALAMSDGGAVPEGAGSLRVWLKEDVGFTARRADTQIAADRVAGVYSTQMWSYVARFEGAEGGTMRVALPSILDEPWNPVAGTNWVYDRMPIHATQDYGVIDDPHTGLQWAQRIESAECVVRAGIPVSKTLDWVDLSFAPLIEVPDDAWADWDASTQTFIAASDMPTPILEANSQCTVTYPADLFATVTWHDGSPLDLSDLIMRLILTFDRGKTDSAIYDESAVGELEAFLQHFRGVKIVSTNPLVITTYDDQTFLDAELMVLPWWPNYGHGSGAWHNVAAGIRAEAAGELAFSVDKADELGVEWMSLIDGPSLGILVDWMNQSATEDYIPYEPTLGAYVSPGEADARWAALQAWYAARGHFWLGTGPYSLGWASPADGTLTLVHNPAFPDAAGRWDAFAAPPNPEMQINHSSGAPGSYFNVTGTGFPPNSTGYIIVNGHLLGELPIDSGGAIFFTLTTGEADPGLYHVRVTANPSGAVQFTLDEAGPVHPRVGNLPLIEVPAGLITHSIYLPLIMRSYDADLLFFDDFSDPDSGWPADPDGNPRFEYLEGEYEVAYDTAWSYAYAVAPLGAIAGNYSIEADVRRTAGTESLYGFAFDWGSETPDYWSAYWFEVDPELQHYTLWRYDDGWVWLAGDSSGYINQGDAANHLKVERRGDEIALFANGHLLTSLMDGTYQNGQPMIILLPKSDAMATARFDNFEVRSLGGELLGLSPGPALGTTPPLHGPVASPDGR